MTLHRKDISDSKDPNPTKDQQYQQPGMKEQRIEGRSFAGAEYAESQREQADERNSGPSTRGNRTDDVQSSDRVAERSARPADEDAPERDVARRVQAARSQLDLERRTETDRND
ncbi:MAG TPA: hypothetical protein VGE02_15100 [Gemmatimonadales bacterium]